MRRHRSTFSIVNTLVVEVYVFFFFFLISFITQEYRTADMHYAEKRSLNREVRHAPSGSTFSTDSMCDG